VDELKKRSNIGLAGCGMRENEGGTRDDRSGMAECEIENGNVETSKKVTLSLT